MGPCHWLASSVIEINPWQKTRHLKLQVMTMRTEDRQRGIFSFCSVLTAEINDLTGDYSNVQKSVALCVKSCLDMSFFGIFFSPFSIVLWFAPIQYSKFLAALSSFLNLANLLFSVLGKPCFASIQHSKLLLFLLSLKTVHQIRQLISNFLFAYLLLLSFIIFFVKTKLAICWRIRRQLSVFLCKFEGILVIMSQMKSWSC